MSCTDQLRLPLLLSVLMVFLSACGSSPSQPSKSAGRVNLNVAAVEVDAAAKTQYQQVLTAVENQDWAAAETQLIQMQTSYPQLASLKVTLGWVYWQGGKVEAATSYLENLIETALYKSDAYNYLAVIYREQGKFKEAESIYLKALEVWPEDPILHKNLGILYELYLDQLPSALNHYQQALALDARDKRLKGWVKDLQRRTATK